MRFLSLILISLVLFTSCRNVRDIAPVKEPASSEVFEEPQVDTMPAEGIAPYTETTEQFTVYTNRPELLDDPFAGKYQEAQQYADGTVVAYDFETTDKTSIDDDPSQYWCTILGDPLRIGDPLTKLLNTEGAVLDKGYAINTVSNSLA